MRDVFILNEICAQDKIFFFGGHFAWLTCFTCDLVLILEPAFCRRFKLAFFYFMTPRRLNENEVTLLSQVIVLLSRRKELLYFGLLIHLHGQYSVPFFFVRCEKRTLFYNLGLTEVCYFNFNKYVIN
jgi:hypothetical protein